MLPQIMRAVTISAFGGPERMALASVGVPQPGPGEALVKLATAGVNYIDIYMRDGSYARSHTYKTPLPMTLGMEGAGTIAALGEGVNGWQVGEPVAYCLARGSYAEYAVVPAWRIVRVPADVPAPIATALMLQGLTAHYLTHSAFRIEPGRSCLVHAGAGGVGQLLIQLAKARGAVVLATAGSAEKAAIARERGADHVILYREQNFRDEVRRLLQGKGVDVVYDSVGRDTLTASLGCLVRRGLCISYGASSGQPAPVSVLDLAEAGSVFLTRPHLADYTASAGEIGARARDLFDLWRQGRLKVAIDRTYDLADAAAAHRDLEGRASRGKLLLKIG